MRNEAIVCYHPTTVFLVDDDQKYLESIRTELDFKHANYKSYNDPIEALNFLTKDYQPDPFTRRCIDHPEQIDPDHRGIDVQPYQIIQEVYNPNRFEQVSVIITDQAMPRLSGLELCREARGVPAKKLMLTGEATTQEAVVAFNEHIIDQFILKSAANFVDTLNNAIYDLQRAHFQELSQVVLESITQSLEHYATSCLADNGYARYFEKLCKQHEIVEYYLTNVYGNYLCLDFNGKPSWVAAVTEEVMCGYDLAIDDWPNTPATVVEGIKQRKMIPLLSPEQNRLLFTSDWEPFMYPITHTIEGQTLANQNETLYVAYITDPRASELAGLAREKIVSFRDFLERQ